MAEVTEIIDSVENTSDSDISLTSPVLPENKHSGFYGWWKNNHFFRSSTTPFQSKWDAGLSVIASILAVVSVPLIMLALPVLALAALLTAIVIFLVALLTPTEHANCRVKMSRDTAWNCVLWSFGLIGLALLTPVIEIALPLLIVPTLIAHNGMRAYKTYLQKNELNEYNGSSTFESGSSFGDDDSIPNTSTNQM